MAKSEIQVAKGDSIFNDVARLEQAIREEAYALFEGRNGKSADPVGDWLAAEESLVWKPAIEVRRNDGAVEILAALPGVEARDIDVRVAPEDVLIQATVNDGHTEKTGDVEVSECKHGHAFRAVHLPTRIDPNRVTAEYRDGMLRLVATAAKPETGSAAGRAV